MRKVFRPSLTKALSEIGPLRVAPEPFHRDDALTLLEKQPTAFSKEDGEVVIPSS